LTNRFSHSLFSILLVVIGIATASTVWLKNHDYYLTPETLRPFNPHFNELKPSGLESHTYGIIGTVLIVSGVAVYSSRKRWRRLSGFGTIRRYLQFHIFVCVLGPILILYHTTFKFGGLVAVSFWSMTAVVLSGVVGRYLYRHIPKNIEGKELSVREVEEQRQRLLEDLRSRYLLDDDTLASIERLDRLPPPSEEIGLFRLFAVLFRNDLGHMSRLRALRTVLSEHHVERSALAEIAHLADERIVLHERMLLLDRLQRVFHYWHVIHIPFTFTLFVILAIHIGVAVAFGYTWVF
jgi:hypothetical protein